MNLIKKTFLYLIFFMSLTSEIFADQKIKTSPSKKDLIFSKKTLPNQPLTSQDENERLEDEAQATFRCLGVMIDCIDALEEGQSADATRVTSLEGRETSLEARATSVEGRETSLEFRVSALEATAPADTTRITSLEGRETSVEFRVSALEASSPDATRVTSVEGRETSVEFRVTSLEGRETSLEFRVTVNESRITSLEGRETSVEFRVTSLEGRETSLEYKVANLFALSAFGEVLTVQPTPTIQLQYPYGNINPNYVTTTTTNGGTVTVTGSNLATLATSTATNGTAMLTSKDRLQYRPGQGCATLFTAIFTAGTAGSSQQIGVGNIVSSAIQDGFFYGYFNGNSFDYSGVANGTYTGATFGIIHTCNGRTFFYPQSTWNVDNFLGGGGSTNPSGLTLVQTDGNVYKIQYQWLGFGAIKFYIENPTTGIFTLAHIIQYSNSNTITTLLNPAMQLMAYVAKTSGASNIILENPSFAGITEGFVDTIHNQRYSANNGFPGATNANTTINNILAIQNNTTFNSITNQVMTYPNFITAYSASGANPVIMNVYLNPTFGTAQSYTNVSTSTSVMSYSTTASTITATGDPLFTFYVAPGTSTTIDLSDQGIIMNPGDVLAIATRTVSGSSTVYASVTWSEGF